MELRGRWSASTATAAPFTRLAQLCLTIHLQTASARQRRPTAARLDVRRIVLMAEKTFMKLSGSVEHTGKDMSCFSVGFVFVLATNRFVMNCRELSESDPPT